jgi:hypothetical protein
MSGLMPLFASAPRLKLRINEKVVAYAIGFNINVSIDVQPVFVIGSYGPISLEPTFHNVVTGTMQIVRLARATTTATIMEASNATAALGGIPKEGITAAAANAAIGNSTWAGGEKTTDVTAAKDAGILGMNSLFTHLDPSLMMASMTFDVQVWMKHPEAVFSTQATIAPPVSAKKTDAEKDALVASLNSTTEKLWMLITDCRLVGRNTNITLGQLVNEPVNFQGLFCTPTSTIGDPLFSADSVVKDAKLA